MIIQFSTMRIIIFMLIGSMAVINVHAQTQPSQKEMQAQLAEARQEALKHISDLKKDIAAAKAKGESQETIKDMEYQLATMEKMYGVIEQVGKVGDEKPKTLPPSKTTEPRYVSPFEPIQLTRKVDAPAKGQAKDTLLWYYGRRIDPNTLITTGSMVVRYDRVNNRVIIQPDQRTDTSYYGMLNTLGQTQSMRNDFVTSMYGIDNSFFMYPEIEKAYDEYYLFRNRYYKVAKNVISVGPPTVTRIPRPDPYLDAKHRDLMAYLNSLPSAYNIKLPPKRPNDLCNCDPAERANYEQALVNWLESAFWIEEEMILHKLKEIYGQIDLRRQNSLPPYAAIPGFREDIIKAFNTVIHRTTIKLDELNKKYEAPDIYVEEGLVMATASFKKMLVQTIADMSEPSTVRLKSDAYSLIDRVENSIMNNTVFEKYMNDQKAVLNYNVVFDYSIYLAHEYNKRIISPSYDLNDNFFNTWIEGLKKFNRFTLTLSMDFKYTQTDNENKALMDADGKLESTPVIVSLGRSSCKWHLYVTNADYKDRSGNEEPFEVPINVISGTKKIYLSTTRTMTYAGPWRMRMVFPTFEISYCPSNSQDQALMDMLRYSDPDLQRHSGDKFEKVYTTDMLQYANKMFLGIKQTKESTYDIAGLVGEMHNIKTGSGQFPQSSGNQHMDELKMAHISEQRRRYAQMNLSSATHTANTIFQFDALNNSRVLIDKIHSTVDTNDKDRTWGIHFTLGEIRLKVIHTPL